MIKAVVLDSTPLGLLIYPAGFKLGDECQDWVRGHIGSGTKIYVPAIVAYELRRELLRLQKSQSLALLDQFVRAVPNRYLLLSDEHLQRAAELWAQVRQKGRPTA